MMASIAILLCQSPKKSDQAQIPADLPAGRCKEPEPRLVDHAHPLSIVGNRTKAWEHSWKPWPLKTLQVGWQSGWIQSHLSQRWIAWNTDFPEIKLHLYINTCREWLTSPEIGRTSRLHPLDPLVPPFIPVIRFTNCDRIWRNDLLMPLAIVTWFSHVLLFVGEKTINTQLFYKTLDWAKKIKTSLQYIQLHTYTTHKSWIPQRFDATLNSMLTTIPILHLPPNHWHLD